MIVRNLRSCQQSPLQNLHWNIPKVKFAFPTTAFFVEINEFSANFLVSKYIIQWNQVSRYRQSSIFIVPNKNVSHYAFYKHDVTGKYYIQRLRQIMQDLWYFLFPGIFPVWIIKLQTSFLIKLWSKDTTMKLKLLLINCLHWVYLVRFKFNVLLKI